MQNKMENIKVYSTFNHSFNCSKENTDIHYYEKQYVKAPNNHVICINSAEDEARGAKFNSIIGKMFQPAYRIELWATKTFEERRTQDLKLQMKRQIIHFCDGTVKVVELKDFTISMNKEIIYWKRRNGKLISVDEMDISLLRNVLKMIIRNREKTKQLIATKPKVEFKLNGDMAQSFNDDMELWEMETETGIL